MKKKYWLFIIIVILCIVSLVLFLLNKKADIDSNDIDENTLYFVKFGNKKIRFERYDYALGQNQTVGVQVKISGSDEYENLTLEPIIVSMKPNFIFFNDKMGFVITKPNLTKDNGYMGVKVTQDGGKTFVNAVINYDNPDIEILTIEDVPYYDGSILKLKGSVYQLNNDRTGYEDVELVFISEDDGLTWNLKNSHIVSDVTEKKLEDLEESESVKSDNKQSNMIEKKNSERNTIVDNSEKESVIQVNDAEEKESATIVEDAKSKENINVLSLKFDGEYELKEMNNVIDLQTVHVQPESVDTSSLKWTSSNEDVAVIENGKIKPLKEGSTTIIVEASNGVSASYTLTVLDPNINHFGISVKINIVRQTLIFEPNEPTVIGFVATYSNSEKNHCNKLDANFRFFRNDEEIKNLTEMETGINNRKDYYTLNDLSGDYYVSYEIKDSCTGSVKKGKSDIKHIDVINN